jgi:actin related protein 2/3 complex subunit 2
MVIFTVNFEDEMEKSLTRLFLQQFEGAQKQVSLSPHCEFRRGNDPPKDVLNLVEQSPNKGNSKPTGYISFTFFPSHVKTLERRLKAVELMVNFFPYLDKHVKSTKSYMHIRMRTKKNDLLNELEEMKAWKGCGKNIFDGSGKIEKKFVASGRTLAKARS